jgi:hypothetical protein
MMIQTITLCPLKLYVKAVVLVQNIVVDISKDMQMKIMLLLTRVSLINEL